MVLFAGPVFTEWYWGPIFFALLFGPVLLPLAFAVDWLVRRRWRLTWPQRCAVAGGVVVSGALCIIGGNALVQDVRFDRDARAAARNLDFQPYQPSPLPRAFSTEAVQARDEYGPPVLVGQYGAGRRAYALAYQQRPTVVSLLDGRCSLRQLAGTGTNFFDGPCRQVRTPGGREVFVGSSRHVVGLSEAFALLGGTLVRVQHTELADRDVLAFYDSLEPVAADELAFKRG
jgi:hypothetical protein